MKKILVLAAILMMVPATAMAGMTAFMGMDELSGNEMSEVTGQTGITIDATFAIGGGYITWGDDDGCAAFSTDGYFTMSTITVSSISVDGLTIDACDDGTNAWINIGMPSITINTSIAALRTSGNGSYGFGAGNSMGSLTIGSLVVTASNVRIRGH